MLAIGCLVRYDSRMTKDEAIARLGGTVSKAAKAIGISAGAVSLWPDDLPKRINDRVVAAIARKHLPPCVLGDGPSKRKPRTASPAQRDAKERA